MTRLLQGRMKANPERGASLVETMIAAAVGLIITAAAVDVFVLHQSHFLAERARSESQQDIRGGINLMGAELRLASPITSMQVQEIVFRANVNGVQGTVLGHIAQGQTSAQVTPSNGWVRGKTVRFCSLSTCEDHRLAHDATSGFLALLDAIRHDFPAGSQVEVINEVRYYLSRTSSVNQKLMREVDRGANPLIEQVIAWLNHGQLPGHEQGNVPPVFKGSVTAPDVIYDAGRVGDDRFLNDTTSGVFRTLAELGRIEQIIVYGSSRPEGLCTVQVISQVQGGVRRSA